MSYLVCWPHVRPWHMRHTEPALRCIPDAERIARLLAEAAETRRRRPAISRAAAGRRRGRGIGAMRHDHRPRTTARPAKRDSEMIPKRAAARDGRAGAGALADRQLTPSLTGRRMPACQPGRPTWSPNAAILLNGGDAQAGHACCDTDGTAADWTCRRAASSPVIQNACCNARGAAAGVDRQAAYASCAYARRPASSSTTPTGWSAELYGFGADNEAAFARLLDWTTKNETEGTNHGTLHEENGNRCPAPSRSATGSKACTPMSASTTARSSTPATRCWSRARRSWPPMARSSSRTAPPPSPAPALLERLWTRLTGDFEFMELCEFSFSEEVAL
ncbi:MAG: hypothetical protein U5J82_15775 [Desulfobacterales bacterium]|nr:hypothetical protein [Desulfobacterales bacterium]